jgi:UDP-glucose 4-epimerase
MRDHGLGRIAITGASSFLGERFLRRLIREGHADDIVVIDVAEPSISEGSIHFRKVDLTEPAADQAMLDVLKADRIETLVHMAFFTNPRRDTTNAHELESIGTLAVLAAAAAANVKNFVMRSFTFVYGARGQNPALIREETPLPERAPLAWLRDKVEAEEHAASFARRYPEMAVRVLRFAPLLGPQVRTFYSRIFDRRLVPTLLGYDPLLQILHPDDAEEALMLAVFSPARGAFNITPRGVLPLSTAIHLSGKVPAPVPHLAASWTVDALYGAGLVEAPSGFIDYVRYPCVADGERAKRVLDFDAKFSSREALDSYLAYRHPSAPVPESRPEPEESEDAPEPSGSVEVFR